jgi:hypothetical protein
MSRFMKEFYRLVGVEGNASMTYHPQTDRQTEWANREVEKYLRMFINHQQSNWADWLLMAEFSYNNTVHEATGYSPFFLNKGRNLRALLANKVADPRTPAKAYLKAIQEATRKAKMSLLKAKAVMKQ